MKASRLTPLTLAASLAWLAGCKVGPDYVRPQAAAPAAYEEAQPAAAGEWKTATPADMTIAGAWWQLFSDPALDGLEVQVGQANQSLKAAEANFHAARSAVTVKRSYEAPTVGVTPAIGAVRESANQPYVSQANSTGGEGSSSLPLDLD